MGGMYLNKENLKGVLDALKERYGDVKLSSLSKKVWDDDDFGEMVVYHKLLYGKRVKINLKSEGIKGRFFKLGKKI